MVTDDPEHKKNLKTALAGAFDDDKISKFIVCCLSTNVTCDCDIPVVEA